jgi:hypothetical protein
MVAVSWSGGTGNSDCFHAVDRNRIAIRNHACDLAFEIRVHLLWPLRAIEQLSKVSNIIHLPGQTHRAG